MRRILLVMAFLLVPGCSDPTGPCDRALACEVSGVDLAITDARIVEGVRLGTDHITGLGIYAAGPVTVEFTIVNRGDSISAPQPISRTDGIVPPLAPGERAHIRITQDFTGEMDVRPSPVTSGFDPRRADIRTISAILEQGFDDLQPDLDADPDNNQLESAQFHVAMPVMVGTMSAADEIQAYVPFVTGFRIDNMSVHGGDAGAFDVVLCIWDFDVGCYGNWYTYFGRFEVPGVEAGWRYENAYATTLDASSMVWPDLAQANRLTLCIVPRDHDSRFLPLPTHCVASAGEPVIRPNYARCDPPVLQLGVPLTIAQANCGDRESPRTNRHFSIAALDAIAGRTYHVAGRSPYVFDADGNRSAIPDPGISVATTGRYYLVYIGSGAVTITVTEST